MSGHTVTKKIWVQVPPRVGERIYSLKDTSRKLGNVVAVIPTGEQRTEVWGVSDYGCAIYAQELAVTIKLNDDAPIDSFVFDE